VRAHAPDRYADPGWCAAHDRVGDTQLAEVIGTCKTLDGAIRAATEEARYFARCYELSH
jgi:hypothetical protein